MATDTDHLINKEWKLIKKIGAGSFGEIYTCVSTLTGLTAAVKLEINKSRATGQLQLEYKILKILKSGDGIVKVFWFGKDDLNKYSCLVMEQLGPSLEDLVVYCKGKLSLKSTIMLADQMIKRIEFMHSRFLIHRDIKPDNFLMGNGKAFNTVYVIDFGLSKQFMDPKTKEHNAFRDKRNLTGTARYCSINAHEGYEQSRRDDLEALGYVFVYFMKGQLPWQGLQADSKREKFRLIHRTKLNTSLDDLCKSLPTEFKTYIMYCKKLEFMEDPDYDYLRRLFWDILERSNLNYDYQFDWIDKK